MPLQTRNYDPAQKAGAEIDTRNIPAGEIVTSDINNKAITGVKLATGQGFFIKSVVVGLGVAEVSLFGTGGLGVASTITGFYVAGLDATAVTVDLVAGEASVGTCVLGGEEATATVMVGPQEAFTVAQVAASANIFLQNNVQAGVMAMITFEIG